MKTTIAALATLATLTAPIAQAQDMTGPVKARQGQFRILGINLGILADMAKGTTDYDPALAQAAADSIVGISMVQQKPLWPEGSSEMDLDGTRAKAEIWDDWDSFAGKWGGLGEAALAMQAAAGTGKDALGPAIGGLGGACKACHDDFRAPM